MMCWKKQNRDEKDDVTLFGGSEWMGDDGKVLTLACSEFIHDIFDVFSKDLQTVLSQSCDLISSASRLVYFINSSTLMEQSICGTEGEERGKRKKD